METRNLFFIVFVFTLFSTMLVAGVSHFVGHTAFNIVIYALTTMWVVGIISQLLLQNLYQGIIRPLQQEREMNKREKANEEVNLDELELIEPALKEENVADKSKSEINEPVGIGKG